MLNLQAVNHFYGNQHSLWNVDLVLRPGECIGVLGREGMGKPRWLTALLATCRWPAAG
nr:urea ABC transporter, ATP-binding protein UrtE [Klebsiella pneumoniae]